MTMNENTFNKGDEVTVVSLEATGASYMGVNPHMACGAQLTVTRRMSRDGGGNKDTYVYKLSDGWTYEGADLQLRVDTTPVDTTPVIEVGDIVEVIEPERSEIEFGAILEDGDTFVVVEVDNDDDSVCDDDGNWVFIDEVCLFRKADAEQVEPVTAERDINFLITRDSVTLSIDGANEVASFDHANFSAIREHVLNEEFDEAMALMNVSVGIQNWGQGSLQIEDGKIVYVGMELTGKLVDRIIEMMGNGDNSFEKFAKFLNLTMEQESFKTRARLMDFAAHDKLDINEDGHVVAFKNVRSDYFDKHSRTFRNMVGDTPSMRRSDVDDDHDRACSNGLHVCSPTYLKGFWGTSGRTIRVVVDPRDFVAIPYDYNDSKARVCKYTVVEDVTDKIDEYL